MEKALLTVVIPAYNEAEALPAVLTDILAFCQSRGWQVVVVNDGSKDDTRAVLKAFADCPFLTVVHHKINSGYGAALKSGIAQARTPYVVTMDSDGQHCIEDAERMLAEMLESDADMVIGARMNNSHPNWYRELGKWLINRITSILLPINVRDLNTGFKLYRTDLVQSYMYNVPNSMAFSDIITLMFISESHLVQEVPVNVRQRSGGKSTISTRTAFETLAAILNIVVFFHPMRIFLPAALFFLIFGVAWGLPIIFAARGVSVGSMLLIVIGVILLFLGLVAEQLSQIRKELVRIRMEKNKDLKQG